MTTRNDIGSQGYCGFVVGQHVVFKFDFPGRYKAKWEKRGVRFPSVGTVYTVRKVLIAPKTREVALLLNEIHNPSITSAGVRTEAFFKARRFRPLQKLKVEDFLSAKTPVDGEQVPA
ncbi:MULTISPECIES: hypothetical protein [unclassified Shinella]|uniref:hypothetical protein n=1 Tax=unclassified Shinella TaxID=2643062 RepID=UPI00225D9C30|nr:conserved hypothetical protein [Rhizobiaceae bacterium]CAK7259117.1 conserved protein of unknown function [Shinella sp. WSC3-e]